MEFGIFVCEKCASIHRSFGHSGTKAISYSDFSKQDVSFLENGGNSVCAKLFFPPNFQQQDKPDPNSKQYASLAQSFIKQIYVDKQYVTKSREKEFQESRRKGSFLKTESASQGNLKDAIVDGDDADDTLKIGKGSSSSGNKKLSMSFEDTLKGNELSDPGKKYNGKIVVMNQQGNNINNNNNSQQQPLAATTSNSSNTKKTLLDLDELFSSQSSSQQQQQQQPQATSFQSFSSTMKQTSGNIVTGDSSSSSSTMYNPFMTMSGGVNDYGQNSSGVGSAGTKGATTYPFPYISTSALTRNTMGMNDNKNNTISSTGPASSLNPFDDDIPSSSVTSSSINYHKNNISTDQNGMFTSAAIPPSSLSSNFAARNGDNTSKLSTNPFDSMFNTNEPPQSSFVTSSIPSSSTTAVATTTTKSVTTGNNNNNNSVKDNNTSITNNMMKLSLNNSSSSLSSSSTFASSSGINNPPVVPINNNVVRSSNSFNNSMSTPTPSNFISNNDNVNIGNKSGSSATSMIYSRDSLQQMAMNSSQFPIDQQKTSPRYNSNNNNIGQMSSSKSSKGNNNINMSNKMPSSPRSIITNTTVTQHHNDGMMDSSTTKPDGMLYQISSEEASEHSWEKSLTNENTRTIDNLRGQANQNPFESQFKVVNPHKINPYQSTNTWNK